MMILNRVTHYAKVAKAPFHVNALITFQFVRKIARLPVMVIVVVVKERVHVLADLTHVKVIVHNHAKVAQMVVVQMTVVVDVLPIVVEIAEQFVHPPNAQIMMGNVATVAVIQFVMVWSSAAIMRVVVSLAPISVPSYKKSPLVPVGRKSKK